MQSTRNIYNLQSLNSLRNFNFRIAIVGGSFDPAHAGHYSISLEALKHYKFDYILWLVANQNPLKPKYNKDIDQRSMEALAITSKCSKIIVTNAEKDLGTIYTYDSIHALKKRFPNVDFTLILGIDNLQNFHKWYKYEALPNLCKIIIFDRPVSSRLANNTLFTLKLKPVIDKIQTRPIILHRGKLMAITSTEIRKLKGHK